MVVESQSRQQSPQQPRNLLTVREFTLLYGLSEFSVRRRIKDGTLTAYKVPGRHGPRYMVVDPGWQNVVLDSARKPWEPIVDDIHILNGKEVAILLGVNPRTVRKMAEDGRIKFTKAGLKQKSHRRYCIADVRRLIATMQKKGYQERRPGRKKTREAILKWAASRLGIKPAIPQYPSLESLD